MAIASPARENSFVQFITIVGLSVLAAITYGIIHDQITARICVEYFTIGHPKIFVTDTNSPALIGLAWGVIATWWLGAILGIPLACAARWGHRNKQTAKSLIRPIAFLLLIMAMCAVLAGLFGHFLASRGAIQLQGPLFVRVPAERHIAFITAGAAHFASYAVGFLGGIVLIVVT